MWWGGAVDGSATKKARRQLREKASDKRGSRVVRIHENKNSTELEFSSTLKYDVVDQWLRNVTGSSKFRLQGRDLTKNDQGHGPVCNAEVPAGVSAASLSANLGESPAAGDQVDALAAAGLLPVHELWRRRAGFMVLKATNLLSSGAHRKTPGKGLQGLGELLGEGTYGKVYRSRHREEDVAIKFMRHREPLVWLTGSLPFLRCPITSTSRSSST